MEGNDLRIRKWKRTAEQSSSQLNLNEKAFEQYFPSPVKRWKGLAEPS